MDTQNTPVHIKLWHRDFWMMAVANMLVMMSVYMLIPTLPAYLRLEGFPAMQVGLIMGVYGLGVFALGGFCSYWLQRYRRNRVCQRAVLGVVICLVLLYYLDFVLNVKMEFWMLFVTRFVLGAFLGLAQMALASTLIIDTCESFQRTEANYTAAWFSRFALSLGPVVALLVFKLLGYGFVLIASAVAALVALVLIALVKFPFKAPSDTLHFLSLDRFFLPQGLLLFLNLALIMTVVGLLFSCHHSEMFYAMLMMGFLLALLAEKYAFADADLKSEVITGLILMGAAVLIQFTHHVAAITFVSPALIGFGIGIMGSRFLLFYIKLAKHCQRGTSQSSFFLACEFGVSLGLFVGMGLLASFNQILYLSLALIVLSLLLYNFVVHPWYMTHKNR